MSDVVKLDPNGRRLVLETRKDRRCRHRRYWLDQTPRKCFCRDCGVEIDPFDLLVDLASTEVDYWYQLKTTHDEIERKKRELEEVNRQLRNAKSRKRRQDKRDDPVPEPPANVVPIKKKRGRR